MNALWAGLELLLWVAAAGLAASRYALPTSVFAAVVGAGAGALLAGRVATSRLRTPALALCALLLALPALVLALLIARTTVLAEALGPRGAYGFAEFLPWGVLPLCAVGLLAALARRHPALRTLELAALAGVFAALFASHREGFVNRPFFLVDPLWSRGRDPLDFFLLLGVVLAVVLAVALAAGSPGRRSAAGLVVIVAALLALFFFLPQGQLKNVAELHRVMGKDGEPDDGGKGGKEPAKPEDEDGGQGGQGGEPGGEGGGDESDLPDSFTDQKGQSNSPVAVAVFHSDFKPPLGYYYFRETAFSTFNGVRLVKDASGRNDRDLLDAFASKPTEVPSAGAPHGTKRLGGAPGDSFAKVSTTVALLSRHPRPFGLANPARFSPAANPDPRRFFRAYDVLSWALTAPPPALLEEEAGGEGWTDDAWRHYTEGPADPRYAALAEEIVSALPAEYRDRPFARAVAVKLWLDKNGTYSMRSGHAEADDPVGEFLFGDRVGHCVHFAHAACLLYRAAGVPARVATGYAVRADFRGGGASLLIRSRDAHAWPEVCLKGPGWIPLDISPEKSLDPPEDAPDPGLQQMLGDMAMGQRPPPPDPEEERPVDWGALLRLLARILGWALVALALLAVAAAHGVKLWRRLAPAWGSAPRRPVTAYRAALDRLAEAGYARGFGETRERFAARCAGACPSVAPLTARHLHYALGRPGSTPPPGDCLDLYRALRAELKRTEGRGRRLLGALDPFSWVRAR